MSFDGPETDYSAMNRWIVSVLVLVCFGKAAIFAADEYNPTLVEARKLEGKKQSAAAEEAYRSAVLFAREKLSKQAESDALYSLGQFFRREGRFKEAIDRLSDSLAMQEQISGAADVRTGRRLAELGAAFLQDRQVSETRKILERLKPIRSKYRGEEKKFVEMLFSSVEELERQKDEFEKIAAAAAAGDVSAKFALASCYEDGVGVAPDSAKAFEIFSALAEQGHVESIFYVGVMHDKARGRPRDATLAAEWYRRAAERGLPVAQFNYAVLLSRGEGGPKDLRQALEWMKKARDGGYPEAKRAVASIEKEIARGEQTAPAEHSK